MNKKRAKQLVEDRIQYEHDTGIDSIPNEILENYSKKDIRRCIKHMLLKRKHLKGVNIKEYMIQWLEKHKNEDWRENLLIGDKNDGERK